MKKPLKLLNWLKKKSPGLWAAGSLLFLGLSVYNAIKDTQKLEKAMEEGKPETTKEKAKVIAKCYIPTGIAVLAAGTCTIASVWAGHKLYAAAASACTIAESSLRLYQDSVREVLPEEELKAVQNKIAEKEVKKSEAPSATQSITVSTGHGDVLCVNGITGGCKFRSSPQFVEKCFNVLNRRLLSEMYVNLNELYSEMDIPPDPVGNDIGWNLNDGEVQLIATSGLTETNEPYLYISCYPKPHTKYM